MNFGKAALDYWFSNMETDERFLRVEEVHSFLRDEVGYDHNAVIYRENGKVKEVKNKTPDEIVKSKKATCVGGIFYAARELRDDFGEEMISLLPIVRANGSISNSWGVPHGMYLFNIFGFYGAISKSKERLLEFVPPRYLTIRSLVLSENILQGYIKLNRLKDKKLVGMGFFVHEIREEYPNYDSDVTNIPIEDVRERMRMVMFQTSYK